MTRDSGGSLITDPAVILWRHHQVHCPPSGDRPFLASSAPCVHHFALSCSLSPRRRPVARMPRLLDCLHATPHRGLRYFSVFTHLASFSSTICLSMPTVAFLHCIRRASRRAPGAVHYPRAHSFSAFSLPFSTGQLSDSLWSLQLVIVT